jgi:hypothetical protein
MVASSTRPHGACHKPGENGRIAFRVTNSPPTIKRAATTAPARLKGHTDYQLLARNGAVEEMRTDIRDE